MTADQGHRQGQVIRRYDRAPVRRPRDVTPALDRADEFERQRELAEQYRCPDRPLGCGVAIGERCRVIGAPDLYLTRRPAHERRLKAAGLAPPSTVGTGAPREQDRPAHAPIPQQNRSLYDDEPLPEEPHEPH